MNARNQRIWSFFAIIFVVFGGATAYLMFFQFGLNVEGKVNLETGKLDISVVNESFHIIQDINVYVMDSTGSQQSLGDQLFTLKPFEKKTVDVNKDHAENGKITLVTIAPHHLSAAKEITVKELGIADITEEVQGPAKAFTNGSTAITVKICNKGKALEGLTVTPLYNTSFFQNEIKSTTVQLPENACVEIPFVFVGQKAGQTAIIFNITADSLSKRVKKDLEIVPGAN